MLRPHRLIITPYLNSRAFVHHRPPGLFRFLPLTPREAVPALLAGKAIAGIVPVGGLNELGFEAELLGQYGIACAGPARSVLLLSKVPFETLGASHHVRLSADSMSSVRLLYLLFAQRKGRRTLPRPAVEGAKIDAELVIGDRALQADVRAEWPYVTDLAELWYTRHKLPMVFARWVVHRRASASMRAHLAWWLSAYGAREEELRVRAAAEDHVMAGLDADAAYTYLQGLNHVLSDEDLAGQALYERELAAHPWIEDLLVPASAASPKTRETSLV